MSSPDAHPSPVVSSAANGGPPHAPASLITGYWFAQLGIWTALLTPVSITIALKVAQITTPDERSGSLGIVLGIGAFVSLIATPVWGALSDRTTLSWGRRRPWLAGGVLAGGIGLILIALAPNMLTLGIGWALCQAAFNAAQAALNATLPDHIAVSQRGRVAGFIGFTQPLGILLGTFLSQFTQASNIGLFLAPYIICVVSVSLFILRLPDRPATRSALPQLTPLRAVTQFWVSPRQHPDYGLAWISRFLVYIGIYLFITFQAYFLLDRLGATAQTVTTLVFESSLITAAVTIVLSIAGGWLSDRIGRRKPLVLAAGLMVAIGLLVLASADSLPMFFLGVALASGGKGFYLSVDLALVADVLPDPETAARDMGTFQIASSLPQSLAPAVAPLFLLIGGGGNYPAVFIAGAVFAAIGALVILGIRGTR